MRKTLRVFGIGLRVMARDAVMLVLIPAPFLVGLLFRLLTLFANGLLTARAGVSLTPWYPLVDGLLLALTPLLPAMASAFLLLEESDEGIGGYYGITPAGRASYLAARLGLPALWGFVCSVLVGLLFGVSALAPGVVVAASFLSALCGVAVAMMVVALAANRVEGLAVSKLAGLTLLGLFVAWFVPGRARYFAALLPTFWLGELTAGRALPPCFAVGALVSVLWVCVFAKRFLAKVG